MSIKLGINTGFALNRFTTPQEWIPLVAEVFGLKYVQFTADLLNPSLPEEIIEKQINYIKDLSKKYGIIICSTFTGAFTRVNHLAHPDPKIRNYWINWFCKYVDISVALGATNMGSHFGILTVRDLENKKLKEERFKQNVEGWKKIAEYAKGKGIEYLTWEPMSIPREMGETLEETKKIHDAVNDNIAIPMKLCLDVDHGDVSSDNPDDTNPYVWIKEFGKYSPIMHIKQTLKDKGGHWPFIHEKNKDGKITPDKLLKEFKNNDIDDVTLFLELSFREREPFESRVINDIKASVEYWKPFVSI